MKYGDLIGVKYRPHGRSKKDGFDCYGLVIEVLRRNGKELPDLYYKSLKVNNDFVMQFDLHTERIDKPEENCLIEMMSYGQPGHIGVYIGEGLMIHSTTSKGVCIEQVRHYSGKIRGYYRVKN